MKFISIKVHLFWEGHKILRHLHFNFVLCSASQKQGEDVAKFCGLLRIYELYQDTNSHSYTNLLLIWFMRFYNFLALSRLYHLFLEILIYFFLYSLHEHAFYMKSVIIVHFFIIGSGRMLDNVFFGQNQQKIGLFYNS